MTDAPDTPAVIPAQAAAVIPAKAGTCPADAADWARAIAMRRIEMLGELAELGLDVARAVERQASGRSDAPVVQGAVFQGDPALAYARVSRAVRLTLMLQARLVQDLTAPEAGAPEAGADEPRAEAAGECGRSTPEHRRKARVERIVERLAEAEHPDDEETVDDLIIKAGERLDDEDLYGDLMQRPLSELVARLCKDLGLEPRWSDLAEELWAVNEVESGHVGWPLAELEVRATSPTLQRGRGGPSAEEPMVEREGGLAPYAGLSENQTLEKALADIDAAFPPLADSS